ncbi:protein FAM227B-like isoform X2 [Hydra vulgaris]|uniref:Protein FAM227B-like isoform X2 n=1 Tax=Hydra vulgaris TaxID=6087 RepID=A0ABM4D9G9_HYDVU
MLPVDHKIPPPSNLEEWLSKNHIEDWPFMIEKDYCCHVDSFSNEKISDKFKTNLLHINSEMERNRDERIRKSNKRKEKNLKGNGSEYVFPGFSHNDFTALPAGFEVHQIFNFVLKNEKFKISKRIIKYVISDASIAVLNDLFWLIYLELLSQQLQEKFHFFNRISKSFVLLLLSIPFNDKDSFLKLYPDCLCQAIYLMFNVSSTFDYLFADWLIKTVFYWLTGVIPNVVGVIKSWNVESLNLPTYLKEHAYTNKEELTRNNDYSDAKDMKDLFFKHLEKNKVLTSFKRNLPSYKFNVEKEKFIPSCKILKQKQPEVLLSPLVSQYLSSKSLQTKNNVMQAAKANINNPINQSKPNIKYHQACENKERKENHNDKVCISLVSCYFKESRKRYEEYKALTSQLQQKLRRIRIQSTKDKNKLQKFHKDLLLNQNEVKILCDTIMASKSFSRPNTHTNNETSKDDKDEYRTSEDDKDEYRT